MLDEAVTTELNQVASDCIAQSESTKAATEQLLLVIQERPDLRERLLAPYEEVAAKNLIRSQTKKARSEIWNRPRDPDQRVNALINANASALMDFRLPGGLPIGHAKRSDLQEASDFYRKQAVDMTWKSLWIKNIAKGMPDGKSVSDRYSEADLVLFKNKSLSDLEEKMK